MVGRRTLQQTLRLENFNLTLPNALQIVLTCIQETVGLIIGSFQELVRDCDCVVPDEGSCIVSMHSNCEQIRQI